MRKNIKVVNSVDVNVRNMNRERAGVFAVKVDNSGNDQRHLIMERAVTMLGPRTELFLGR